MIRYIYDDVLDEPTEFERESRAESSDCHICDNPKVNQANRSGWCSSCGSKAQAAQLAEALQGIMTEFRESDNDAPHLKVYAKAKQALASYETAR